MSSAKWRLFCLGLNELRLTQCQWSKPDKHDSNFKEKDPTQKYSISILINSRSWSFRLQYCSQLLLLEKGCNNTWKVAVIFRWYFQTHFQVRKLQNFLKNIAVVCSSKLNWQYVTIGSGNDLSPVQWVIEAMWRIYLLVNLTIIHWNNGLSLVRHQTIIWTNAGFLIIGVQRINFNVIWILIQYSPCQKTDVKMSSAKWCTFYSRHLCINSKKSLLLRAL